MAELIIISIPLDATEKILPVMLDLMDNQIVMDAGSAKSVICDSISNHPKRDRFVASYPMWGIGYSGTVAAVKNAFLNKAAVI